MKKLDPIEKARRKRERDNARANAETIAAVNRRLIFDCEVSVPCTKCSAMPGERCTWEHGGSFGVSMAPHPERKRDYGRVLRIAVIAAAIRKHTAEVTRRGAAPDPDELATAIEDALHPVVAATPE